MTFVERFLSADQGQTTQILSIEPEQIEPVEAGITSVHQCIELGMPASIKADDLSVENGVFSTVVSCDAVTGDRGFCRRAFYARLA